MARIPCRTGPLRPDTGLIEVAGAPIVASGNYPLSTPDLQDRTAAVASIPDPSYNCPALRRQTAHAGRHRRIHTRTTNRHRGPSAEGRCRGIRGSPTPELVAPPRPMTAALPAIAGQVPTSEFQTMPQVTMRQMLEAGVHFGHQTRYWNPQDGAVHLRRARQDPHHQPRRDGADVHRRDELPVRPGAEARHHAVRRHQALGARGDRRGGRSAAACPTSTPAGWVAC